jgi:hypothetical protein
LCWRSSMLAERCVETFYNVFHNLDYWTPRTLTTPPPSVHSRCTCTLPLTKPRDLFAVAIRCFDMFAVEREIWLFSSFDTLILWFMCMRISDKLSSCLRNEKLSCNIWARRLCPSC